MTSSKKRKSKSVQNRRGQSGVANLSKCFSMYPLKNIRKYDGFKEEKNEMIVPKDCIY